MKISFDDAAVSYRRRDGRCVLKVGKQKAPALDGLALRVLP